MGRLFVFFQSMPHNLPIFGQNPNRRTYLNQFPVMS